MRLVGPIRSLGLALEHQPLPLPAPEEQRHQHLPDGLFGIAEK